MLCIGCEVAPSKILRLSGAENGLVALSKGVDAVDSESETGTLRLLLWVIARAVAICMRRRGMCRKEGGKGNAMRS